jgi:hypothetical protein
MQGTWGSKDSTMGIQGWFSSGYLIDGNYIVGFGYSISMDANYSQDIWAGTSKKIINNTIDSYIGAGNQVTIDNNTIDSTLTPAGRGHVSGAPQAIEAGANCSITNNHITRTVGGIGFGGINQTISNNHFRFVGEASYGYGVIQYTRYNPYYYSDSIGVNLIIGNTFDSCRAITDIDIGSGWEWAGYKLDSVYAPRNQIIISHNISNYAYGRFLGTTNSSNLDVNHNVIRNAGRAFNDATLWSSAICELGNCNNRYTENTIINTLSGGYGVYNGIMLAGKSTAGHNTFYGLRGLPYCGYYYKTIYSTSYSPVAIDGKQTIDNRTEEITYSAFPDYGNYEVGDFIKRSMDDTITAYLPGWNCVQAGTAGFWWDSAGTGSPKANTTSSSKTITINGYLSTHPPIIGTHILIAGVTGIKQILSWDGRTRSAVLDSTCDATVTNAAITYSPPEIVDCAYVGGSIKDLVAGTKPDVIVNGDMEIDDPWTEVDYAVATNERSSVDKYSGTYSKHVVFNNPVGQQSGVQPPGISLTAGNVYTIKYDIRVKQGLIKLNTVGTSQVLEGPDDAWHHREWSIVPPITGNFTFYNALWGTTAEFYLDNVSCQETGFLKTVNGKVGIGKTPTEMLDVNGNIQSDSMRANYGIKIGTDGNYIIQAQVSADTLKFTVGVITYNAVITQVSPIAVAKGGTGAATLTGILKGNGTSAFTAITGGESRTITFKDQAGHEHSFVYTDGVLTGYTYTP